jgi:hypothetical protein
VVIDSISCGLRPAKQQTKQTNKYKAARQNVVGQPQTEKTEKKNKGTPFNFK